MPSRLAHLLIALPLLLSVLSCAKMGVPPGGPEDKIGPAIAKNYPERDAVNMPRWMIARLEFSEPVNRASVEAALFLSPDPRQRLRYHWRGNALELIYLDSLELNRTYVISVGSQAKDLRGNPAGSTFTIAFSTGDQIDRGRVHGWVDGIDVPQAVSIWAYGLREDSSASPLIRTADYAVQAGSDGTFLMEYLREGRYRVFAVHDRNHDGLWNPPEPIAIPPWDTEVSENLSPWLSFRLAAQDTNAVFVRSVRAIHDELIDVRTNRPASSINGALMGVDSIEIIDCYPDTSGNDLWHCFPAQALTEGVWILHAGGVDEFGDQWTDSDTMEVKTRPDTSRPQIRTTMPPRRERARLDCDRIRLEFTEPIAADSLSWGGFFLTVHDTDTVAVAVEHPSPRILDFRPPENLTEGLGYRLDLNGRMILDRSGNLFSDTLVTMRFAVWPEDSLGTLIGQIKSDKSGKFLIRVVTAENRMSVTEISAEANREFRIPRLPVDQYVCQVAWDRNGDGRYTYGRVRPLEFAEPFWQSPDTVSTRARWEYESVISWPDSL